MKMLIGTIISSCCIPRGENPWMQASPITRSAGGVVIATTITGSASVMITTTAVIATTAVAAGTGMTG
jgi:hypothetical protein